MILADTNILGTFARVDALDLLFDQRRTRPGNAAMEVECTAADGRGTGKRLYLQLKAGNSYLQRRKRDGAEIFKIGGRRRCGAVGCRGQAGFELMLVSYRFNGFLDDIYATLVVRLHHTSGSNTTSFVATPPTSRR